MLVEVKVRTERNGEVSDPQKTLQRLSEVSSKEYPRAA